MVRATDPGHLDGQQRGQPASNPLATASHQFDWTGGAGSGAGSGSAWASDGRASNGVGSRADGTRMDGGDGGRMGGGVAMSQATQIPTLATSSASAPAVQWARGSRSHRHRVNRPGGGGVGASPGGLNRSSKVRLTSATSSGEVESSAADASRSSRMSVSSNRSSSRANAR